MDFNRYSLELEPSFEILAEKERQYDPRNWERLWSGYAARWVFKFLAQAMMASVDSLCLNRHTGACLVDIKEQQNGDLAPFAVSRCFNGAPTGIKNCVAQGRCFYKEKAMEAFRLKYPGLKELTNPLRKEFAEYKKAFFQFCVACHAETNAIYFSRVLPWGKMLFCTTDPCPECAKVLTQQGIAAVVYSVPYKRDASGPRLVEQSRYFFDEAQIPCVNINIPNEFFGWFIENIRGAGQPIKDNIYDLVTQTIPIL